MASNKKNSLFIRHRKIKFKVWKKKFPPQRQDPLRLPGRAQLPGHGVQVQGGGRPQRDARQVLLPPGQLFIYEAVVITFTLN